jgi:hypothetical protein
MPRQKKEKNFTKMPSIRDKVDLPKGLRNEDLTGFARGVEIQRVFFNPNTHSIVGSCLWPKVKVHQF